MSNPLENSKQNLTVFREFVEKLSLSKSGRFCYTNTENSYDIFEIRQAFDWVKSHSEQSKELENSIENRLSFLQESLNKEAIRIRRLSPYKSSLIQDFSVPNEDFREFSLLDSFKAPCSYLDTDLKNPETHLFAHLHLGSKALRTGFEGETTLNTASWLETTLTAMENPSVAKSLLPVAQTKKLKESVTGLIECGRQMSLNATFLQMIDLSIFGSRRNNVSNQIRSFAMQIGSSVQNLAPGASYLMPGGYLASPAGHAMIYRFTKETDGTYTVVLYNAGEGAEWQNLLEEKEGLTKVNPCVVFSGVREEELFPKSKDQSFIESHPFFESLLKPQILPSVFPLDPTCRFSIEDVWKAFFPLHHRQIDSSEYISLFMTLQRSGTCSQKSLNACVLDLLRDPVAYKALNFNSQMLSLMHYYHAHAQGLGDPSLEMNRLRFQLKEATTHLFQKLLRYAEGKKGSYPHLSPEQLKAYTGTLQELMDKLEAAEKQAVHHFQEKSIQKKRISESKKDPRALQEMRKGVLESRPLTSPKIDTPVFSSVSSLDPGEVPKRLRELFLMAGGEYKGRPQPFLLLIEKFFCALPVPIAEQDDPFWSKVPLSLDLLKDFSSILRFYISESTRDKPLHHLWQYQTVLAGYAAMHQLCWRYDREFAKGFLQDYSVSTSLFENLLKNDPFLLVEDPKEWERYSSLLDYFKGQQKEDKDIFSYNEVKSIGSDKFQAEVELYGKIVSIFPNKKQCEQYLNKRKKELDSREIFVTTDEQLFAEDILKEGWISQGWFSKHRPYLNLLHHTKHEHIAIFKQLAFDALVAFDTQGPKKDENTISSEFSYSGLRIENLGRKFCLDDSSSSFGQEYSQGGKHLWSQEVLEELSKDYLKKYFDEKSISEGEHLIEMSKLEGIAKRRAHLAGALCYRETAGSTLLYRITQDPLLLFDPVAQAIVQRILWRPHAFSEGMQVPLFEEMQERGEIFLQQVREAVDRGLQYSLYAQSSDNADLGSALFFVQFAQQVEECYRKIHGKSPDRPFYPSDIFEKLEQAARQRKPAESSLSGVCLLRLNHKLALSQPQARGIYQDWMLLKSLQGLVKAVDSKLWDAVCQKMRMLESSFSEHLEESSGLDQNVLNDVCACLGVDDGISFWQAEKKDQKSLKKAVWKQMPGSLTFRRQDGITVNLSEGRVVSRDGELQLGTSKIQTKDFQKIFGERRFLIQKFGSLTQFYDERYGLCTLLVNGVIQRKVGESWYSYVPEDLFEKQAPQLKIPKALYGGYVHWIRVGPSKDIDLRISDQQSAEDRFVVNEKGELFPLENEKQILEPLPQFEKGLLHRFEKRGYVLGWKTESGEMSRLEMPRYRTKMGKSLAFVKRGDDWVYESDPRYSLDKTPFLPSLGHFSKFLLLSDEKGKEKRCLIPYHKMESTGFSTQAKMRLIQPSAWEKQQGIYSYFEFAVKEGELVADNIDGWLLLAQIYMAEKDYIRAGRCLDQITLSDQLTPETRELFRALLLSGKETQDFSPNASALRLKAFLMLKKLDPFTKEDATLQEDSEHRSIHHVYDFYLKGLSNVYDPLKLSRSAEQQLISLLGGFENRQRYLSGESWDDIKTIWKTPSENKVDKGRLEEWDLPKMIKELDQQESDFYYPQRFLSLYTTFKTSFDSTQKNSIAYELQWRGLKSRFPNSEALLYFVYKYPNKCPKPVHQNDKEGIKELFVKTLVEALNEHLKEDPTFLEDPSLFRSSRPVHQMESYKEKSIQQPRRKERSLKTPLVSPSEVMQWDLFTSDLARQYIERKPLSSPPQEFQVKCNLDGLTEEEKPYANAIKNEFEVFNEELKRGRKRLQEELPWNIKEGQEAELKVSLEKFDEKMVSVCDSLEKEALRLSRKLPPKEGLEEQKLLSQQGYRSKPVTMLDLARIAVKGTEEAYKKVAPHLVSSEIQELHRYVIEYMIAQTTRNHLQSVLSQLKDVENPRLLLEEKKSLLGKAAKFLAMSRQYDPEKNVSALFFEYVSGLRLRKEQATLFKQLIGILFSKGSQKAKGVAFQMMQAGGKSSVILSRLMELLSDEGYLSFFVCHHSQMRSAMGNMKRYQRERFEKNVIPLDYAEDKLKNVDVLEHILNTLRAAKKEKDSVLLSSRFVQLLQGQVLILLKERRSLEDKKELELLDRKISTLQAINREILESGAGMFDEGDLSLNILQQVNIPNGVRRRLPPQWIALALKIFQKLGSQEVDKLLHLSKNDQSNFSLSDYTKLIVPEVGRLLIKEVPALKLKREQEAPFLRYLRWIDPKIEKMALEGLSPQNLTQEQQEDLDFLKYLHQTLRASPEIEEQEAAKQIALARGILHKLLPVTLKKVYNRDYGPDPKAPEKTIPYDAVDSPSDAEVGNVFELLCYVLQSALNASLPEAVVRLYAEKMTRLANSQISQTLSFEKTAEAELFFKMTGVPLSKVFEGGHLQKAALALNENPLHKLNIQAILAEELVSYYPEFIAMNPLSMVDQFSLALVTSGTLANVNSFHSKVAHPLLDEGAEGKIISTLLERFDGKGKKIQPVDVTDLPKFIEKSLKLVPDEENHCFFDGEGLLTRFSGGQVAREIFNYFAKRPKAKIEGVVYYQTSKEGKEGWVLMKKKSSQPIPLADTSKAEIEKHGIPVKQLFFNIDELRSTGTDFPMPPKANGVGTVGVGELRKVGQMVMRLRELFEGQDLQIVVSQSAHQSVLAKSSKLLDLLEKSLTHQAINKAEETLRSLKQQIPNLIRDRLMREIIYATPERASAIERDYAPFFETTNPEDPFEMFGFAEEKKTGIEILKNEKERQLRLLRQCALKTPELFSKKALLKIFEQSKESIEKEICRAENLPELQCLFADTRPSGLGLQMQTSLEQNLQQETHMKTSLELDEELRSYRGEVSAPVIQEVDWHPEGITPWNPNKIGPTLHEVSTILKDVDFDDGWVKKKGLYRRDYSSCFPSHIQMTQNLRRTLAGKPLPLFHPLQKGATGVLLRQKENGELESILLSQKDVDFWLRQKKTPKGVWLFNPNGSLLTACEDSLPEEKLIEESLWYANFFNGNIPNLMRKGRLTSYLIKVNPLRRHFLLMKAGENLDHRHLLETSTLFNEELQLSTVQAFKRQEERLQVEKMSPEEIENLPVEKISYVPVDKVQFLKKAEQIHVLDTKQLEGLVPAQMSLVSLHQISDLEKPELIHALKETSQIKRVSLRAAKHLTSAQKKRHPLGVRELKTKEEITGLKDPELIAYLGKEQLEPILIEQVPHLNEECVSALRKKEQIEALQGAKQINAVSLESLGLLTKEQVGFLSNPTLVQALAPEMIQYLPVEAIPLLNVLSQLAFLTEDKYMYIGLSQYEELRSLAKSSEQSTVVHLRPRRQHLFVAEDKGPEKSQEELFERVKLVEEEFHWKALEFIDTFQSRFAKSPEQPFPVHLRAIWSAISPDALGIYKQILGQVALYDEIGEQEFQKKFKERHGAGLKKRKDFFDMQKEAFARKIEKKRSDETEWFYYLKHINILKEQDYGKVAIVYNMLRDHSSYIPINQIFKCKNLQRLELARCDFTDNDQLFSMENSLPKLTDLDLIHCKMDRVPTFIKNSKGLNALYILPTNPNVELPDWIFDMSSLTYLGLCGPWIKELPSKVSNLKNLMYLVVTNTEIKNLPEEITQLKKLKQLHVTRNSFLQGLPKGLTGVEVFWDDRPSLYTQDVTNDIVVEQPKVAEILEEDAELPPVETPPSTPQSLWTRLTEGGPFRKKLEIAHELRQQCADKMPRSLLVEGCRSGSENGSLAKIADIFEWLHRQFVGFVLSGERLLRRIQKSQAPESAEMIARALFLLEPRLRKKQQELEGISKKMKAGSLTFDQLSGEEKRDYLDWVQGTEDEITMKQQFLQNAHKGNPEKIIANLFLDKVWVMTSVSEVENAERLNAFGIYGMAPHIAAGSIRAGIGKVVVSGDEERSDLNEFVKNQLLPPLEQATFWSYLMDRKEGIGVVLEQFQEKLSKMQVGERVLLPVGTLDHNFLVQIHRTSEQKCDFTVVNTGAGLEAHPRFGDIRKFQTALSYSVPFKDIHQQEVWKKILNCQSEGSEMVSSIYDEIKKLTTRGRKAPPSDNILDYSTAQLQATCSAAPWWAWLRHEVMGFASSHKAGNKLSALTEWRVFKNEIKKEIVKGFEATKVRKHITDSCQSKIEKQGQICALLKICGNKERFNQAIRQMSLLLKEITGKSLLFVEQDYDHYPNGASRWYKLSELSKRVAHEILYLEEGAQEKFINILSKHLEGGVHLGISYLTFLDLKQTEGNLEKLFEDAKRKGEWKVIGQTLGRLALDPKLGPLAVSLARKWLVPDGVDAPSAKEQILERFLYFVSRGRGQEHALRSLAIHFRTKDKALAKELWVQHRIYSGQKINALIAVGLVAVEDLELIEETPLELQQITSLIFAMKAIPLDQKAMGVLSRLASKALALEDKDCPHLREVTQRLLNDGFVQIGEEIIRLKNDKGR